MNFNVVPIQELYDKQIVELAALHHSVIHSLLSDLGLPFLEKYYDITRRDKTVIGFCALSEEGLPLGWVVGSPKPEYLNNQLTQPLIWFVFQLLRIAIMHPLFFWQLFVSVRSASLELKPDQIEVIYIGVSPSVRRLGVGRAIIDTFIQACKEHYRSIVLSVEIENISAIQLYTTFGFQVVDTFTEGKFRRHRMELKL